MNEYPYTVAIPFQFTTLPEFMSVIREHIKSTPSEQMDVIIGTYIAKNYFNVEYGCRMRDSNDLLMITIIDDHRVKLWITIGSHDKDKILLAKLKYS